MFFDPSKKIGEGEVLADGTIKVETSKIGAQFHLAAEKFMSMLAQLAGGATSRKARGTHTHAHHHGSQSQTHSH